jgi:hypothetical protein
MTGLSWKTFFPLTVMDDRTSKRYPSPLSAGEGNRTRTAERLRHFKEQDLLDLQVWFFLA